MVSLLKRFVTSGNRFTIEPLLRDIGWLGSALGLYLITKGSLHLLIVMMICALVVLDFIAGIRNMEEK